VSGDLRSFGLVVSRELREALRRKAIWITVAITLAGTTALMVLPSLLGGSDDERHVAVVGTPSEVFSSTLEQLGGQLELRPLLEPLPDEAAARRAVEQDDVDAAVILGGPPHLIVDQNGGALVAVLRQAMATDRSVEQLRAEGLDDAQIGRALAAPDVGVDVVDADRASRVVAASVVAVAVYLLLFVVTMQVANAVAIEKANRVSEVLLAIVAPRPMLFGKVVGIGLTAGLPLVAAALPVLVRLGASGGLPPSTGRAVAAGAAWFILGSGSYLLAASALGALVERQEEAGSSVAGLSVCLVGSYLVGQSAPDTPLGAVLAYLPFTSPMVEPARLALGVSSVFEVVASLLISLVALVVMAKLSAVVYGRAVVRTGRRLRVREVLRPVAA
jgi:ABC-2 type transport system permease protein